MLKARSRRLTMALAAGAITMSGAAGALAAEASPGGGQRAADVGTRRRNRIVLSRYVRDGDGLTGDFGVLHHARPKPSGLGDFDVLRHRISEGHE